MTGITYTQLVEQSTNHPNYATIRDKYERKTWEGGKECGLARVYN